MSRRVGTGLATVAGNPITFSQPLFGTYEVFFTPGAGIDYVDPVTGQDTRTAFGFTAFAASDGVSFAYLAENIQ